MEGSKRAEEGQSSGGSVACAVEDKVQKQGDVTEEVSEDESHEIGGEDDDGNVDSSAAFAGFIPSPLVPLKVQIEKDKGDESLRRWKEKLLGCLESDLIDQMEPEVNFHSIGIISNEVREITAPLPVDESQNGRVLFSLKEGSHYQFKLTFTVKHNIVSGLAYSNTVWKGGIRDKTMYYSTLKCLPKRPRFVFQVAGTVVLYCLVDHSKGMLGTFAPQQEPYVHTLDEETTPSGVLARGLYTAKLKLVDDDKRCHMKLKYSFEIKKNG